MKQLLVALLVSVLALGCSDERTVDQQIIATLESMEIAAEDGQHLDFMGYVAESFSGQQGSMERRDFHRFMLFQMNQNRRLEARFFPIEVQAQSESSASAAFNMLITGGSGLLPERGQLFEVKTSWVKQGSDWLLVEANWQAVRLHQE